MNAPLDNEKAPRLGPGGDAAAASSCHDQNRHGSGLGIKISDNAEAVNKNSLGDPVADTGAALTFLERWRPGGPWVLTSIIPDGKTTTTTFTADKVDELRAWVDERQGVENIYFSVNDPARALKSKAKKADIAFARALHVDIDPRVGEDVEAERGRALRLLRAFDPPPTIIIDSGGGYQGFWLLDELEPVPDAERDEDGGWPKLEGRNLAIEAALQADACHNIDRIMRLPGTINVPGEKKRKKGRVPALARVVEADWSRRYRLHDFTPAPRVQDASPTVDPVKLSADLPPLDSLDDLPKGVSDRIKTLIVNGCDPEDPTKYPSRSEALFAVLCDMVRADCSDDQMAAVILDPDYGISESVLDKPRPKPYAARQIQRARDEAEAPELRELNDNHTVLLNQDDKCVVLEFVEQPTGVRGKTRRVASQQSFEAFGQRYMNRKVVVGRDKNGNDITAKLGTWWLEHPKRRQHHSLTFQPRDGAVVGDKLNLWEGFSVQSRPGDWSLMQAHIRDVIAGGDEVSAEYILKWLAWTVQNPDQPAEVALVLRGERGTGKGVFGREIAGLFGQHGLHTGGTELLTAKFNLHFRDCCLLFADEVVWDGDKKAEAKLKTFLTEPTLVIEGKGKDVVTWPNMLHVVISSNDDWIVPAGPYERRFAIFDVSSEKRQKDAYFKPLYAQLDNGGREAMLHDLLNMDLGDWHPRRDVPQTAALDDQKARGLDPIRAVLLDMLHEGSVPVGMLSFRRRHGNVVPDPRGSAAQPFVATEKVVEMVQRQSRVPVTRNAVSSALERLGCTKERSQRPSGWTLPVLKEARAMWNGLPDLPAQRWIDPEADWVPPAVDPPADYGDEDDVPF